MDNLRLVLVMTLVFISLLLYQAWQADYGPKPGIVPPTSRTGPAGPTVTTPGQTQTDTPVVSAPGSTDLPVTQAQTDNLLQTAGRVTVDTDLLRLEIDLQGGDVRRADLLQYPLVIDKPEEPVRLLDDQLPHLFVMQSGLLSDTLAPTHQSRFTAEQTQYRLAAGAEQLEVRLHWQAPADSPAAGLQVTKIYRFKRGSYAIDLDYEVSNQGATPWSGRLYGQLQRTSTSNMPSSYFIYTFLGGAIASPETRYQKIAFDKMQKLGANGHVGPDGTLYPAAQAGWVGGWVAMLQHYFVASLIPVDDQPYQYYTKTLGQGQGDVRYALGLYGQPVTAAAGQQARLSFRFYVGPKLQDNLAAVAPGLELTVDYGYLWFIAQPLFALLEFIHKLLGNWGWSIIILTVLIKLAFFHLSATSYKSMANMRRIQPRLVSLKERYADDRAGLNQAMMDLYKKEKINPLGGCLPILIQIPVFISLYWVLLESVEMRQAPFMLWLSNLSAPDPYFILPLIMGATMVIQNKLNPAPVDPVQQKVMMMLPLMFTVFFAFFPVGLVLYWTVNNILSIAQQWYITNKIAPNT